MTAAVEPGRPRTPSLDREIPQPLLRLAIYRETAESRPRTLHRAGPLDPRQLGRGSEARLRDDGRHQRAIGNADRTRHSVWGARPPRASRVHRGTCVAGSSSAVPAHRLRSWDPRGSTHRLAPPDLHCHPQVGSSLKWLVRLYPPAWRERYEEEFVALLEAQGMSPSVAVDVCRGAADAWLRGPRGQLGVVGVGLALAAYVFGSWVLAAARRAWVGPGDGALETAYQSLYWFVSIVFMTWLASRPSLRCDVSGLISRLRR